MKSIFDGWTNQQRGAYSEDGGHCAVGYVKHVMGMANFRSVEEGEIIQRIGKWIIANMNPPANFPITDRGCAFLLHPLTQPAAAVVWANDEGLLDIQGFVTVDLLTQGYVPEEAPIPESVSQ